MDAEKQTWMEATNDLDVIMEERRQLLAPTEDRYNRAMSHLADVEEGFSDKVDRCMACGDPIFPDEKRGNGGDGSLCVDDAHSYQDMLENYTEFWDAEENALTIGRAKEIIDKHLAGGGKLSDKIVH